MKRFRIHITLRTQLVMTYLFLFLILFASFSFFLLKSVENELNNRTRDNLIQYGTFISNLFTHSMVRHMLTQGQRTLIVLEMKRLSLRTDSWIAIVNQKAFVLENTANLQNHWVGDRREIREALRGDNGVVFQKDSQGKKIYVAVPVFLNGIVVGAIYLSKSLNANQQFLSSLEQNLIQDAGIICIVMLALVIIVADLLTRSLRKMTEGVRRMQGGGAGIPTKELPSNEIGLLGQALNEMAQALKTQMEKLSFLLSRMADAVLMIGSDGRIEYANDQARKFLNLENLDEIPADSPLAPFLSNLSKGEGPPLIEFEAPGQRVLRAIATPVFQLEKPAGLIAVFHDVSEYKQLEKLRAQFVSDVSHELKTPLSSIKALCDVLLEGALEEPEHGKKFLGLMEEEVDRLSRLVKDLLDLSKLESGIFPLQKEKIILEELLRETIEKFSTDRIQMLLPDSQTIVEADPDRIRQVFYNLFDNTLRAVSTSQDPRIETTIQKWQGKAVVSIKDNGIGIPPSDLPRIFERFYRVDSSRTRKDGGTGLGLAIVKQIVEASGGEIWAESSPPQGSTFSFTLPLPKPF